MPLIKTQSGTSFSNRYRLVGLSLGAAILVLVLLILWGQKKAAAIVQTSLMQTARELDIGLGLGDVSVKIFKPQLSVELTGLSLGTSEKRLALHSTDLLVKVAWSSLFHDTVRISQLFIEKAAVAVQVDSSGNNNWDDLIVRLLSLESNDSQGPPFDQLLINNLELEYNNERLDHEGLFQANGKLDLIKTQEVSTLELTGDLNNFLFQTTLETGGEYASARNVDTRNVEISDQMQTEIDQILPKGLPVSLNTTFGEVEIAINARVQETLSPLGMAGEITFSGHNTSQLLRDLKLMNTNVSQVSGELSFAISEGRYLLADARIELGSSDLSGGLFLDTAEQPGIIFGQLTSTRLALDELLGTSNQPLNVQGNEDSRLTASGERLFSSHPFKPAAWFSNLKGTVSGAFNTITLGAMRIEDLVVNNSFENDTTSLELDSEHFAGGSLALNVDISATDDAGIGTRTSKVSLKLQQVQLLDLLSLSSVSSAAGRGKLSGEGTFWLEGFSPSSVAASIDGGLFTIIEDGELDSMLVELAGADLMESISLLIKRDLQQTSIRCGFFDVQASSGVVEIKDFIIDTDDSYFLAKGRVDLNDETISMKFEPHPRDASLFAAPTALLVSGSLMSPSMEPGRSLYSRIAVATALAALAGPAAIVLPFIEVGRGGKPSSCSNLFSEQ